MAQDALDDLHWLCSTAGVPALADGEVDTVVDAGMALGTSLTKAEHTYMIYRTSQTHWDATRGREHAGGPVPRRRHGRRRLEVAGTTF